MTRDERKALLIRELDARKIESVPMPSADEFCHGDYERDGKCCTLGWASVTFGAKPGRPFFAGWTNLSNELSRFVLGLDAVHHIASVNDSTPKPTLARKWRKAMGELGFDNVVEVTP